MRELILNYRQYGYSRAAEASLVLFGGARWASISDSARRLKSHVEPRMKLFMFALIVLTAVAAAVYIVEINRVMLYGKKMPALEASLRDLTSKEKLKRAELTGLYAPTIVKQEAVGGRHMVEVSSIRYIQDIEVAAANLITSP